ncbi:uncharacterized protein [Anas platyrhynchos]|uniref:uncharacterized protein n=1 Tax=Anas platyrhynchos TaxID=8839 RepID=UPI003AF2A8ED
MPQPPAQRSRRFLSENSPTPEAPSEGDEEGGMPPRQPRLAWQETWSSRGSNRPAEDSLLAEDRTPVEAFLPAEDSSPAEAIAQAAGSSQVEESQDDVQWLDPSKAWKLCRDKAVEFIRVYVRGTEKDDEEQKMLFLSKICDLCTCVTERGVPMNLHGFCSKHKLVENIMALLEKEPMDSLRTAFRQKAMETVALLSNTVPTALCGKKESLLNMCCKSIFFLPPESDVPETGVLYAKTMVRLSTKPWRASYSTVPSPVSTYRCRIC